LSDDCQKTFVSSQLQRNQIRFQNQQTKNEIGKSQMMQSTKTGFLALTLVSMLASTAAFAATPAQIVAVSLSGEAGEPMKIAVDKVAVKAGALEFAVTNDAIGTDHEMVLIKVSDRNVTLTPDAKTHRIDEKKLVSMGEVAGLKSGDTGKLKVNLAPGEYVLLCNHKSHYELGMATHLTVVN
jgi:uncharacterized cupredoxin-like copper-binding protein